MKMFEFRKNLKKLLANHSIPASDVDFIIAEYLGVRVTDLVLIDELSDPQKVDIMRLIKERLKFKPVEKMFGRAYFYGLTFKVNEAVLSPRADSEILVDTALGFIKERRLNSVLDLCTGSGILAVAVKKNSNVTMTASDVSLPALEIAKENATLNGTEIEFVLSDMFEKIDGKFDLIMSNPPYISSDQISSLDPEVRLYDPHIALDGGQDGLEFYKKIHSESKRHLNKNGLIILEIGWDQLEKICAIFSDFHLLEAKKDYGGRDRVLVFENKEIV